MMPGGPSRPDEHAECHDSGTGVLELGSVRDGTSVSDCSLSMPLVGRVCESAAIQFAGSGEDAVPS